MANKSKLPTAPKLTQLVSYEKRFVLSCKWRCANFPVGVPAAMQEALDETAHARAFEMIQKGFVEGELNDYVNMSVDGVETPEDGFHCTGWWEFKAIEAGLPQ